MSKIRNPERFILWQSSEPQKGWSELKKALCPILCQHLDDALHHFIEEVWERGLFHAIAYLGSWHVIGEISHVTFQADIVAMMRSTPDLLVQFSWQHRNRKPKRSLVLRIERHSYRRPPKIDVVSFHARIAEIEAMLLEVQKTWARTHESFDPLLRRAQSRVVSAS